MDNKHEQSCALLANALGLLNMNVPDQDHLAELICDHLNEIKYETSESKEWGLCINCNSYGLLLNDGCNSCCHSDD